MTTISPYYRAAAVSKDIDVSFEFYSLQYSSEGWLGRKVEALPGFLIAVVIKTTYHIAMAIIVGVPKLFERDSKRFEAELCNAARDIEEAFGYFVVIFNDERGSFYLERSQFFKEKNIQWAVESKDFFEPPHLPLPPPLPPPKAKTPPPSPKSPPHIRYPTNHVFTPPRTPSPLTPPPSRHPRTPYTPGTTPLPPRIRFPSSAKHTPRILQLKHRFQNCESLAEMDIATLKAFRELLEQRLEEIDPHETIRKNLNPTFPSIPPPPPLVPPPPLAAPLPPPANINRGESFADQLASQRLKKGAPRSPNPSQKRGDLLTSIAGFQRGQLKKTEPLPKTGPAPDSFVAQMAARRTGLESPPSSPDSKSPPNLLAVLQCAFAQFQNRQTDSDEEEERSFDTSFSSPAVSEVRSLTETIQALKQEEQEVKHHSPYSQSLLSKALDAHPSQESRLDTKVFQQRPSPHKPSGRPAPNPNRFAHLRKRSAQLQEELTSAGKTKEKAEGATDDLSGLSLIERRKREMGLI